jgi:ABC-2 type transport system permease protein
MTSLAADAPAPARPAGSPAWLTFRDALHAEWTKLRTVPGTIWLLGGVVVATAALGAVADAATRCAAAAAAACQVDPARTSLTGIYLSQAVVVILAVLAIGNEYGTGMMRVTLTAVPRRTTVLAAKAVILTVLVLAAGTIAIAAAIAAGRLILPGHGFTAAHGYPALSPGDGPVLRAACGSVLYLGLIGLLSLGAAAALRDTAAATGVVLGLLFLFPIIATVAGPDWGRHFQQIGPMTAGLAIEDTTGLGGPPIAPWAGLGVLAAWAAVSLVAGWLVLRRRDA